MWLAKNKLTRSPLKRLHTMSAASQFASTMATRLTAGLPLVKCLEVTANVHRQRYGCRGYPQDPAGRGAGPGAGRVYGRKSYFPKMLTEMTGVGEHSGNLEETLTVIAEYFDNEVDVTTTRLLSLLEPCITIGLAILTVALLLGVYLPLFSMYGSM